MKVKCTTEHWDFFTSGKEYEVIRKEDCGYFVYADDGNEVILCDHECEVIEESTLEPTKEFKVGDKVKIVKKVEPAGWGGWVLAMDKTIGEIGIITYVSKADDFVTLKCGDWWYPEESLELVEETKQDEIEEEPVQCNEALEDYSSYPRPVIVNAPLVDFISYQEFLDAFDDKNVYVTISKGSVVIDIQGDDVYQRFECTTKQREQEVMKALIVLYGKHEGENK